MPLPLPKVVYDVGPGGGITTSMKGINALRADQLNNEILRSKAEYAPYTNYADAASKIAYSQFVGPQAIAAILTNAATRGMFTPEQYKNLANVFARQVQSPGLTLANLPPPRRRGNILDTLRNIFIGGSDRTISPSVTTAPQQSSTQDFGAMNKASPEEVSEIAQNGNNAFNNIPSSTPSNVLGGTSPTYNRLSKNIPGGMYGAASPGAVTQAGEAALKAQTEEEAKAITNQWKERQDDINTQVSGAQEMSRQLDKLIDARSRLKNIEKGPFLGRLPAVSTAAQDADIAISNLVAARLKAWQSSRITNMDIGFGQMLKPGRYMNDDSFHNEVNYEKGLSSRMQEFPAFSQRAQMMNLTPAQADAIWARYANEKPFYNPKTKKVLGGNLDSWEQYLDPNSIQETFSPSFKNKMDKYRKNMAGGSPNEDEKIQSNLDNKSKHGVELLAKNLELPTFKNKKEFQDWYANQSKIVQDAVRMKLEKENGI